MSDDFDVLVVGAGPVGLWVACELALAKVNVVVVERRAGPVTQSRGLAIQGRTLDVFALRGLADRFLSRGRPIPKGHFGLLGTGLDFSVFDTHFPFTLVQPQATTEMLLEERALELGVDIRRGHSSKRRSHVRTALSSRAGTARHPSVFLRAMPSGLMALGASCGVRPASISLVIPHSTLSCWQTSYSMRHRHNRWSQW